MRVERWFQYGITCLDHKDCAGASDSFQKAIEVDPRVGASWSMLGIARAKEISASVKFVASFGDLSLPAGRVIGNLLCWV